MGGDMYCEHSIERTVCPDCIKRSKQRDKVSNASSQWHSQRRIDRERRHHAYKSESDAQTMAVRSEITLTRKEWERMIGDETVKLIYPKGRT